jgi:hypothetical protein
MPQLTFDFPAISHLTSMVVSDRGSSRASGRTRAAGLSACFCFV